MNASSSNPPRLASLSKSMRKSKSEYRVLKHYDFRDTVLTMRYREFIRQFHGVVQSYSKVSCLVWSIAVMGLSTFNWVAPCMNQGHTLFFDIEKVLYKIVVVQYVIVLVSWVVLIKRGSPHWVFICTNISKIMAVVLFGISLYTMFSYFPTLDNNCDQLTKVQISAILIGFVYSFLICSVFLLDAIRQYLVPTFICWWIEGIYFHAWRLIVWEEVTLELPILQTTDPTSDTKTRVVKGAYIEVAGDRSEIRIMFSKIKKFLCCLRPKNTPKQKGIMWYVGEINSTGQPHGFGHWRADRYHGESVVGLWRNGVPIAPYKSREFGTGSGFMSIKIGWVKFTTDSDNLSIGVSDVECCVSGAFFRTFPRVLHAEAPISEKSGKRSFISEDDAEPDGADSAMVLVQTGRTGMARKSSALEPRVLTQLFRRSTRNLPDSESMFRQRQSAMKWVFQRLTPHLPTFGILYNTEVNVTVDRERGLYVAGWVPMASRENVDFSSLLPSKGDVSSQSSIGGSGELLLCDSDRQKGNSDKNDSETHDLPSDLQNDEKFETNDEKSERNDQKSEKYNQKSEKNDEKLNERKRSFNGFFECGIVQKDKITTQPENTILTQNDPTTSAPPPENPDNNPPSLPNNLSLPNTPRGLAERFAEKSFNPIVKEVAKRGTELNMRGLKSGLQDLEDAAVTRQPVLVQRELSRGQRHLKGNKAARVMQQAKAPFKEMRGQLEPVGVRLAKEIPLVAEKARKREGEIRSEKRKTTTIIPEFYVENKEYHRPAHLSLHMDVIYRNPSAKKHSDFINFIDPPNLLPELALGGWMRAEDAGVSEAWIYVHGFNNRHTESLQILGQLAAFGNFPTYIKPFLFTWPSGRLPEFLKAQKIASSVETWDGFLNFLQTFADQGVQHIHIMAHSMGSRLVINSLRKAITQLDLFHPTINAGNGANSPPKLYLATLTFLNPEYYLDDFVVKDYSTLRRYCNHITLYCDSHDQALYWSELISGRLALGRNVFGMYTRRVAGGGDEEEGPKKLQWTSTMGYFQDHQPEDTKHDSRDWLDVDVIDTTWLGANVHQMRHSYWNLNREIIEDLRELIVTRKRAAERKSRLDRREGNVWVHRVAPSNITSIFESDI